MKPLQKFFMKEFRGLYRHEKRWLLILPEVARKMPPQAVERAVTQHLEQTAARVIQLEQIYFLMAAADGRDSPRLKGCLREADEVLMAVTLSSKIVREHVREGIPLAPAIGRCDRRMRTFCSRSSQN